MNSFISEKNQANSCNYCVIVPTYNNEKTLKRVLDAILKHTSNIIIVNDGSTDTTSSILKEYSQQIQIHISKNSG